MLILTRRIGETLIIETPAGGHIEVAVKSDQVRTVTPVSLWGALDALFSPSPSEP